MRFILVFEPVIILQLKESFFNIVIWWDSQWFFDIFKDENHIFFDIIKWILFFEIFTYYDMFFLFELEVDNV